MTSALLRRTVHCGFGAALLALLGCGEKDKAGKAETPIPWVTVAPPVQRTVSNYVYANGRFEPLEKVEIRARVSGYLNSIHFKPGSEVKKDDLLFEIDPEPYKADLARAKANESTAIANVASAKADLSKAETRVFTTKSEYDRVQASFDKGAAAKSELDKTKGDYDESVSTVNAGKAKILVAEAQVAESRAAVQTASLNLGYCTIRSPIAGIIGDKLVTQGNLITGGQANSTILTTIVADEQMDVAFDVDENTLQKIKKAVREGKIKEMKPGEIVAEAGLSSESNSYPLRGFVNFADNRVDPKTGTMRIKARFDNPKPAVGQRVLSAGMYAHIRVPIGEPVPAMLVPDAAFGSDQGSRFLYIVGPDNKATQWTANTGNLDGDLRVVESIEIPGKEKPRPLTTADRIIVTGIQKIRPGMTVDPKPAAKIEGKK